MANKKEIRGSGGPGARFDSFSRPFVEENQQLQALNFFF